MLINCKLLNSFDGKWSNTVHQSAQREAKAMLLGFVLVLTVCSPVHLHSCCTSTFPSSHGAPGRGWTCVPDLRTLSNMELGRLTNAQTPEESSTFPGGIWQSLSESHASSCPAPSSCWGCRAHAEAEFSRARENESWHLECLGLSNISRLHRGWF